MWFRRRHRSDFELKTRGDTDFRNHPLERSGVAASARSPSAACSVDRAPDGAASAAVTSDPASTGEVGVQIEFAPDDVVSTTVTSNSASTAEAAIQIMPAVALLRNKQATRFEPDKRPPARELAPGAAPPGQGYSAYDGLRNQIIQRIQEKGWDTVAVTSPSRGSGTTFTAINLSISIARDPAYTVFLVELDFIKPSFRELLGLRQTKGIVDHLLHGVPISKISFTVGIDRLVVIPAGSTVANAEELLSSPRMSLFVEELKRHCKHPIVVFDLPSSQAFDNAMAFPRFADCALLVVNEGETRVYDVRRALESLKSTSVLGVVLNRSIHAENDGG
jgi:protein-tyrosine kinase